MAKNNGSPRSAERARLATLLSDQSVRAVVVSSYQAVSYFSRTQIMTQVSLPDRLAFLALFQDGEPTLLVCNLETSMVESQTDVEVVREYTEFADIPARALADLLREHGIKSGRVGIEARRLPVEASEILCAELPGIEFVAVDDDIERLQAVKEQYEIEHLQYAGQSTRDSILDAAAKASASITEQAFCADVVSGMMMRGGIPAFIVFGSGERGLQAHAEPIDRPLREGEIWRIDAGARFYDVFNSDLARTGVVGEPTARQEEVLQSLRATQDAGFAAIEPGRPGREVFNAVKEEFERQGLPFFMPHIGHGLGIGLHEFPMLQPGNSAPLEVGMVLCVEPMVRLADRNECYHVEDLVAVTEDGYRVLTEPQESLVRIGG